LGIGSQGDRTNDQKCAEHEYEDVMVEGIGGVCFHFKQTSGLGTLPMSSTRPGILATTGVHPVFSCTSRPILRPPPFTPFTPHLPVSTSHPRSATFSHWGSCSPASPGGAPGGHCQSTEACRSGAWMPECRRR